jgi:hypothetical protein
MVTKTKLQQISDEAWLVRQGEKKLGILNKDVREHYTYITGQTIQVFTDDLEVRDHFGNIKLFEEQIDTPSSVPDEFFINGHKIDINNPIPIEENDPRYNKEIPLYLKTESSDVLYAAGWYCINFEKGWKHGHGPKYTTLTNYGYEGPFKTKEECRAMLKKLNKAKKING